MGEQAGIMPGLAALLPQPRAELWGWGVTPGHPMGLSHLAELRRALASAFGKILPEKSVLGEGELPFLLGVVV